MLQTMQRTIQFHNFPVFDAYFPLCAMLISECICRRFDYRRMLAWLRFTSLALKYYDKHAHTHTQACSILRRRMYCLWPWYSSVVARKLEIAEVGKEIAIERQCKKKAAWSENQQPKSSKLFWHNTATHTHTHLRMLFTSYRMFIASSLLFLQRNYHVIELRF